MFAWAGGYVCTRAYAQAPADTIRYVRMTADGGSYSHNGKSWAEAKDKVQDAINDLHGYLQANHLTSGSVYIAAGTYVPTESTEDAGGSLFNTSFKIYEGIHVYGGFRPDAPEAKPGDRIMANGKKVSENWSDPSGYGTVSGDSISSQWDLKHKTILTGNHTSTPPTFVFDPIRGRYNTAFPSSSFHVVWFATNGKYEGVNVPDSAVGHFKPLDYPASLDGCVISSGSASTQNVQVREHTAYGGGVYMVGNSSMRACTVERCVATMRGGGIYCDGGGDIEFCYVHTCQATGVGVLEGYGGGVCIDYDGSCGHSHITNCAARCGGGLMIAHIVEEYPEVARDTVISPYSPFSSASVINNNTASAEGGGVYLADGGTINHGTVCGNDCVGQDVTYYGRRHGRTGGIYVRNAGMIFNSVCWGNRCAVNNDIQFASVRQKLLPMGGGTDPQQVYVYHSAFMNHDISDWTGATKDRVFSLDKSNMPKEGSRANFPCFFHPTVDPNNWQRFDTVGGEQIHGAGVFLRLKRYVDIPGPRIWHLTSYSAIDQKGVQVSEAVQNVSPWLIHAHTDYGVVSNPYEPSSTLGGLVRKPDPIVYSLVKPQGLEGREGPDKDTPIPTLFVDPHRTGVFDSEGQFVPQEKEGNSWTTPIKDLGEGVEYFRKRFVDTDPANRYYRLPEYDNEGHLTGDSINFRNIQILVKEGNLTTIGPGNYVNKNLRSAAIVLYGHMRLYGGYPTALEGTNTEGRNVKDYQTVIRANVTGEETARAYENNSAHLVSYVNADSTIVDGFMLMDGNTHDVFGGLASNDGGGVVMNNSTIAKSKRVNMVGNQLRNCVVGNCASPRASGIFVNGEYPKGDDEICYAELKVVNTVIRNNKSSSKLNADTMNGAGIVTANGRAYIHLDHCNIVNNTGYPLKANNRPTVGVGSLPYTGYIRMDNSIVYNNGDKAIESSADLGKPGYGKVTSVFPEGDAEDRIYGTYNMFDSDIEIHTGNNHRPHGFFSNDFTIAAIDGFVPAGVISRLTDDVANLPQDSLSRNNQCNLSRVSTDTNFPVFMNPTRTIGNSKSGDKALYGGSISYTPMNTNPVVNAANYADWHNEYNNYDRTDVEKRTRGGAPDIGAIENTDLPPEGAVIYVTPEGRGKMDGSSWANAIAGNLVYQVGGSYVVDAEHADSLGTNYVTTKNRLYREGYAVDYVWHTGKIKYIDTQTVTQKRINMTYYEDGSVKKEDGPETPLEEKTYQDSTSYSNNLKREKSNFIYGEKSGSSRNFFRTNLIDSQISSVTIDNAGYKNVRMDTAWHITNNREEDYVSGLQFAVEKAAEINKNREKEERVQVWVGNGVYEDYKGYVMRDKVEVYGGFPAKRYAAPGMSERHALVSDRIPLSTKSAIPDSLKYQYETILQISDKKPFDESTWTFDESVMLYRDKDYTESGEKTITTTTTITIPVYYRRDSLPAGGYSEYYEVPGGNVAADLTDRIINPGFEQNAGMVCTGDKFEGEKWNETKAKYGWTSDVVFSLGESANKHCAKIVDVTELNFYQDIENLEKGLYRVSCQAFNKGDARNNVKLFANGEERVLKSVTSSGDSWSNYVTLLATGAYDANWVDVYVGESGHLRIGLKGSYSGSGITVFDNFKLERLSGGEDITSSTVVEKASGYKEKAEKTNKHISAFRKPVLFMPDVCMPTYWPGTCTYPNGTIGDNVSNSRRQKKENKVYTTKPLEGSGYVAYEDVRWDGFTIRNGFIYDYYANRDGGAGVRMFEGGTLAYCVVTDNANHCGYRTRGGGGYCDGRTSQAIGCFFVNNLTSTVKTGNAGKDANGGGIYMLVGTCYNSLLANNRCWSPDAKGAGIYIEQATFYNNTVAYNRCFDGSKNPYNKKGNGIHQYEGYDKEGTLNVFNTIFYGNAGPAIGSQAEAQLNKFKNCYIQSATAMSSTIMGKMVDCKVYNGKSTAQAPNPFEKGEDAPNQNNFRLKEGSECINKGDIPDDFVGDFPDKDVDFANRIQDCQIDIGAYEFNAAYNIQPDTITHPGIAIYYTAYESPGGDASARSPHDAACLQKLQLVLDAAGRYKYNLMKRTYTLPLPTTPISGKPDSTWSVEVWLQGDSLGSRKSDTYYAQYTPTRSTKYDENGYHDNSLDYSFIVPHGIVVKGGFEDGFYHMENAANGKTVVDIHGNKLVDTTGMTFRYVDHRDPLTFRTVMSGNVTSSTGAKGQAYHVVTFTNNLFDLDEHRKGEGGQLADLTKEKDRAVLDGLFLMDGDANSPDEEGTYGGAAIVTDYAHIRNCVIQNNAADDYGGGLYLKPFALVSGCIIKNNSADMGAGVYVEAPATGNPDSVAHVYNSTICENRAAASAGGMWFDNTYVRVNSTALWHNEANDNANVSGNFTRTSENTDYPFNFCAVESRRLEGQANIELSPLETEGVRWDKKDPFSAILYYPIEMSSTLARAGMTYNEWDSVARVKFPTLDTLDIARVHRAQWTKENIARGFAWGSAGYAANYDTLVVKNNDFIDIGARAINKDYAISVDKKYILHRLYVMKSELIDSEAARKLQDNTSTDSIANVYRQMGSCIYNPFHRLGDAFDYIIAARKSNPAEYRNRVFEIFIEAGTYYPYHNAYGEQDQVRNNTFLVPEAVYVIGGIDSQQADHKYGQDGYYDQFTAKRIGNAKVDVVIPGAELTINAADLDSIRLRDAKHRPMRDYNMNSVIEPWEFEHQTILSGNAVSGDNFTHVYHVITMHADSNYVGPQPHMFTQPNPAYIGGDKTQPMFLLKDTISRADTAHFANEYTLSILGRTTEFDGIQITGGYANHLNPEDTINHIYVKKTYFRGGGMFIDGAWGPQLTDATLPNMTEPAKYNIPIIVENCVFTDNMAGNGGGLYSNGGIYMFGCHFTQNYSQGPMEPLDTLFIPWTAGGCIATNAGCYVGNTLFDNNEARRGLYPLAVKGADYIPDADARQGFGGVLSVAAESRMRVVNCHFMKNKAVAFPAIYNFKPNNLYSDPDSMQYAFNTIFWGNESFDAPTLSALDHVKAPPQASEDAYQDKYYAARKGVFHYDSKFWTVDGNNIYERLFNEYTSRYNAWVENDRADPEADSYALVKQKLDSLRLIGDSIEGMFFCSYRKTYGPSGMKPSKDGYLLLKEDTLGHGFIDPRQKPSQVKGTLTESYDNLFSYLGGNNNTLINPINNAIDGPNFRQPTFVAGIDGYMQNADWLLARLNKTTDQGWGHMKQKVKRIPKYIIAYGHVSFDKFDDAYKAARDSIIARGESLDPTDEYIKSKIVYNSGMPVASFDSVPANQQDSMSIYNFYAKRYGAFTSKTNPPLPLGTQQYMTYTRTSSSTETSGVMNRISMNPRMDVEDVYIDVGLYEYQYVTLNIDGKAIDTMWVATKEKGSDHDGLTWETPTTDLQMAIDMLMSSRDNRDKYICFLGDDEGSLAPSNVLDNRLTFLISSNSRQPMLPDSAMADHDYGVNSLNFLGGYSYNVKDAPRDPVSNPTVIEMPAGSNKAQLNQLFIIEDMTRQMTQANWQGESHSRDSVVIPITFDGITFINPYSEKDHRSDSLSFGGQQNRKGGAAIYYRWQRRYEQTGGNFKPNMNAVLHPDSALIDGKKTVLPKLTISNCIFMDNGSREPDTIAARSHAVRIEHGGGSSLIVNSLFHSNAGNPIYAQTYGEPVGENDLASAPNDVVIVNSTFALNDGHINLESDSSQVHNSLIWLDDLMSDTTVQLVLGEHQWDKAANRTKPGVDKLMTNNAVWGCFMMAGDAFGNDSLVTTNNDIKGGPGFLNPHVTATTSHEFRKRNFRLNPSFMTMNQADTTLYKTKVFFRHYPDTSAAVDGKYWRRSNGFKAVHVVTLANDSDLACKPRLSGEGMERGAYECLAEMQRVLYVDATKSESQGGDGSTWEKAFARNQLQNAIDAAAVYAYLKQGAGRENRWAYVFVYQDNTPVSYHIEARDGVKVFGSIPTSFKAMAIADSVGDGKTFSDAECQRYVNYVRSQSTGVASPDATPTRISSITASSDEFKTGFLMEGFVITNPGRRLTASPIILDDDSITLRNCLIVDNKVDSGAPVAQVTHGLLYNNLFYNDSAAMIVRVGERGLALNNTVVTTSEDVTPIDVTNARSGAAQNNIALKPSEVKCFAPYMTAANSYTLPNYLTSNASLAYQLHEHSTYINAGATALPDLFDDCITDKVIDFEHDRDILGNPRKIGSSVDMGALETWRVEKNRYTEITAITNPATHANDSAVQAASFLTNFGGNYYPHAGSVVYLMDSAAMTMQYAIKEDFHPYTFNDGPSLSTIALTPGFVLLKPGASFYGNGREVKFAYLAAEKRFKNQRYSMTAFPFKYDTANITVMAYNDAAGTIAPARSPFTFKTYQYNGVARSAKDYVFQTHNSSLWLPVDTANRTATEGYLMDFETTRDTLLRFNAFAANKNEYVYTENTDTVKIVYLTQYDNRTAGTGDTLNFTRQEDMGWNMKGIPWLVSDYRTDTLVDVSDPYLRQMHIPHVLYQMDGAGNFRDGDNVYSIRSWEPVTTLSMGNAFLTQTATTKERETLHFFLPYYARNDKRPARPLLSVSRRPDSWLSPVNEDILTLMPDDEVSKTVNYAYGRDAVKWMSFANSAQIYLLDAKRTTRISLLGAAPTEIDIPMGVYVPVSDNPAPFIFSLPEKEAFDGYEYVWLIDYEKNHYINLLFEDYEVNLEPGEYNTRFAVRIGGFPKTGADGKRDYVVFSFGGTLFVRGLINGDRLAVYAPDGKLIYCTTASSSEFSMPLYYQTGYVVRINDKAYKVVNQ